MSQIVIMNLLLINMISFLQLKHPLIMGLTLILQTILICLFIGISSNSFWFSYILFLIFIGGMLILFIYMASLSSNEKIKVSLVFWLSIFFYTNFSFMIIYMIDQFFYSNYNMNLEMKDLLDTKQLINENYLLLSKIYEQPNNLLTILLILYLLLTLIIIVKVTNSFMGPLRKKN